MRITTVKFTQKANLGNYESLEFTAEAVIDMDSNQTPEEAASLLSDYVDWHAKRPLREQSLREWTAVLNSPEPADEKAKAEWQIKHANAVKWMAKYEERKARVEGL